VWRRPAIGWRLARPARCCSSSPLRSVLMRRSLEQLNLHSSASSWIRRLGSALGRGRSGWRAHDQGSQEGSLSRSGGLDKDVAYREAPSRERVTHFGG